MNLGAMNLNLNLPGTIGSAAGGAGNNLHLSDLPGVSINSLERKTSFYHFLKPIDFLILMIDFSRC